MHPEVKVRHWVRAGTSRGRSYRKDIAAYQELLRTWPSDRCLEVFRIRYSEVEDVRTLMSTLVPTAVYQVDGKNLAVIGSAKDLAQARELVHEIDQPLDQVMIDFRLSEYSTEIQRKSGVVWSDPALTETRMEYVLGTPLSKRSTAGPSGMKLGSFAVSSWIAPREPSVVVPLLRE